MLRTYTTHWLTICKHIDEYLAMRSPDAHTAKVNLDTYFRHLQAINHIWGYGVLYTAVQNVLRVEVTFPGDTRIFSKVVDCSAKPQPVSEDPYDAYDRAMKGI